MFDADQVQSLVSTGVLNIMKDSFTAVALISVMFYQNWKLALFAILMMPLAGGLAKNLGKRIGKAIGEAGDLSGKLTSFLSEIIKGSRMIRIYQKEKQENFPVNVFGVEIDTHCPLFAYFRKPGFYFHLLLFCSIVPY